MTNFKKTRISCRAVIVHNHKILLQNTNNRSFWNSPGGGFELTDASFADCVVREAKEETGMDVVCDRLLFVQEFHDHGTAQVELFFLVHPTDERQYRMDHVDPTDPERQHRLEWFDLDELVDLEIKPEFMKYNLQPALDSPVEIYTTD